MKVVTVMVGKTWSGQLKKSFADITNGIRKMQSFGF